MKIFKPFFVLIFFITCSVAVEAELLTNKNIAVEVDSRSSIRVFYRDDTGKMFPLTEAGASTFRLKGANDFLVYDSVLETCTNILGLGERLTIHAKSKKKGIDRRLIFEYGENHPNVILVKSYYNPGTTSLKINNLIEYKLTFLPDNETSRDHQPQIFLGAASKWGFDYIFQNKKLNGKFPGFGGIPYCDVWNSKFGLGIGSVSLIPQEFTIKIKRKKRKKTTHIFIKLPKQFLSQNSNSLISSFLLIAHKGDYFSGVKAYADAMKAIGLPIISNYSPASYNQHWETYGYEEEWTVNDVTNRLSELKELGIGTITIDSGWYKDFLTGDYQPDPKLFPNGDADVRKMVQTIHNAGLKVKLWWTPGAAEKDSQLSKNHPEWLVLKKNGRPAKSLDATRESDDRALCPCLSEVINFHTQFVSKAMIDWGFDGFKMDFVYSGAQCYAKNHKHISSFDSVIAYPLIFKAIAETAFAINSNALLEICNCGVAQNMFLFPYENQPITSDPIGSAQIRKRVKLFKAFFGANAPVLADHVELTKLVNRKEKERNGNVDFASCLGVGAVIQTKYTNFSLPDEYIFYKKWLQKGKKLNLPSGEYVGSLYNLSFDFPEAHIIKKGITNYYAFFVEPWNEIFAGKIELRGLDNSITYTVEDYMENKSFGDITASSSFINVTFTNHLLLRAVPK